MTTSGFDESKVLLDVFDPNHVTFEHKHRAIDLLIDLWLRMLSENRLDNFCLVQNPHSWGPHHWLKKLKTTDTRLVILGYSQTILGFVQLEHFRPRRAQAHWMVFGKMNPLRIRAGRVVVKKLLERFDLDVIYGFAPAIFPAAIKYAYAIGGTTAGVLPGGSYVWYLRKSVDSNIIVFER